MTDRGQREGMQEKLCKQRAEYILKTQKEETKACKSITRKAGVLEVIDLVSSVRKQTEKNGKELTRTHNHNCYIPFSGW